MIVLWWGATLFGVLSVLCAAVYTGIVVQRLCLGEPVLAPLLTSVGYAVYAVACLSVRTVWGVVAALFVWAAIRGVITAIEKQTSTPPDPATTP